MRTFDDAPRSSGAVLSGKMIKTLYSRRVRWIKVHPTRPLRRGKVQVSYGLCPSSNAGRKPGRTLEDLPTVARLSRGDELAIAPMKRAGLGSQY